MYLHLVEGEVNFYSTGKYIPANLESVVSSKRRVILGQGNEHIATVEHLLAALYITGWWRNLVIEVKGGEVPILDGSAEPWLELIANLGTPPPKPKTYQLSKSTNFRWQKSFIQLDPSEQNSLCVSIDYPHPAINSQNWCGKPTQYSELLRARTFGFADELKTLHQQGLALGKKHDNCLVFDNKNPLMPLRFINEPARHKALDALGDMFLLGKPHQGKLSIHRGSHTAHIAFLKKIKQEDQSFCE